MVVCFVEQARQQAAQAGPYVRSLAANKLEPE